MQFDYAAGATSSAQILLQRKHLRLWHLVCTAELRTPTKDATTVDWVAFFTGTLVFPAMLGLMWPLLAVMRWRRRRWSDRGLLIKGQIQTNRQPVNGRWISLDDFPAADRRVLAELIEERAS